MIKKIYQIIILCAMAVALVSCDSIKKSRLNDALENNDFVKAYQYAKALEESNQGEDFLSEVIKKEAQYVLDNQGEAGLVRISMIVNEHNASWVYLDVLKMAISMGDEELAIKIYNMSDKCDEQCVDYVVTAKMERLLKTFIDKELSYLCKNNVVDFLKVCGTYKDYQKKYILNNIQTSKLNLSECSLPSGLHLCTEDVCYDGGKNLERKYQNYIEEVHNHNMKCMAALNEAIELGDKKFAESIVDYFVKNMHAVATGKTKWASSYGYAQYYKISWDYQDKNEALSLIRKAIKEKKVK